MFQFQQANQICMPQSARSAGRSHTEWFQGTIIVTPARRHVPPSHDCNENMVIGNNTSSFIAGRSPQEWWIQMERIQMERMATTSGLGWPTQRLPSVCLCSPQEPQTPLRPVWLTGLHGTIPSRGGSRHPPVSTALFYPDPDTATPDSH